MSFQFTYLLTPWCRVLLEKLTGLQLVKKFPAFHGTQRFITALTSVRHLSLSLASPIQSIYPHPTSWRSILILSTHLRLGLPSGLFTSGFPTKTLRKTFYVEYFPRTLECCSEPLQQYQQYSEVEVFLKLIRSRSAALVFGLFLPHSHFFKKKKSSSFLFDKQLSMFVLTEQKNLAARS